MKIMIRAIKKTSRSAVCLIMQTKDNNELKTTNQIKSSSQFSVEGGNNIMQ